MPAFSLRFTSTTLPERGVSTVPYGSCSRIGLYTLICAPEQTRCQIRSRETALQTVGLRRGGAGALAAAAAAAGARGGGGVYLGRLRGVSHRG